MRLPSRAKGAASGQARVRSIFLAGRASKTKGLPRTGNPFFVDRREGGGQERRLLAGGGRPDD